MCNIVNGQLWKNLRAGLNKSERAKLLRELRKVRDSGQFMNSHRPSLGDAFVWFASPQGYEFWKQQHRDFLRRNPGLDDELYL